MGGNIYVDSVASYGYKVGASAAMGTSHEIPGKPGKRIAIKSYGCYPGGTAQTLYFMQALTATAVTTLVASGGSTIAYDTECATASCAAGDTICVVQNNGAYHFSVIGSKRTLSVVLCTVVTGAIAAGNAFYHMLNDEDTGHIQVYMANSTLKEQTIDGGIFYGSAKGYPMIMSIAGANVGDYLSWCTVDYINK